jgi:hypothetical protein
MEIDTRDVELIDNPLHRALTAEVLLGHAERMVEYLKVLRSSAMRDHARQVGGYQAAEDLNMNRSSMYRAIRKGVSSVAVERDDAYWQRQAAALDQRLVTNGTKKIAVHIWWNLQVQSGLGNRTPMQAWNAGDREAVLALVP